MEEKCTVRSLDIYYPARKTTALSYCNRYYMLANCLVLAARFSYTKVRVYDLAAAQEQ
jgi:hypothetical protein